MASLDYVRAYIDDLLIITRGTLEDHLSKVDTVLTRLRDAGLKVNAAKSFFCTHEIEYLGYILTRGGIKPQLKKVRAILALEPPQNVKGLRCGARQCGTKTLILLPRKSFLTSFFMSGFVFVTQLLGDATDFSN